MSENRRKSKEITGKIRKSPEITEKDRKRPEIGGKSTEILKNVFFAILMFFNYKLMIKLSFI